MIRRLLLYTRPHLGLLLAAFGMMVVLALSTGAFVFLTGPALRYLLTGGTAIPQMQGMLRFLEGPLTRGKSFIPIAIAGLAVIKGLAYLGQFYFSGLFGQKVVASLRRDFFLRLCGLSPVRLTEQRSGDLLSRFGSDMAAVELAAVYAIASYIRDGLQVLVLVGSAVWLNWRLSFGALVLLPLGAIPVSLLTRFVLRRTREAQGQLGALAAQLKEGLGNLRTVQAFDAFEVERVRFGAQSLAHRRALVRAAWARGVVPGIMEVLGAMGIAGVLIWVSAHHVVSPDDLVAFLVTLVLVYQPAKELGRSTQFAQAALAAGERIFELLDEGQQQRSAAGTTLARDVECEVSFDDVHFSYGDRPALNGLSLRIPKGQLTAVVGPSGAGKSTLSVLLLRFAEPSRGRLLLDGEDFRSYSLDSIRARFALVTQEPLLFAGSILENLRIARPAATLAEVIEAAQVAQADAFIRETPEGYDTRVGERGVKLSGGQRQRLCLARAVLSGASVLVLDEATSSLDPQSEREVQTALDRVLRGRTALVIAHRLSTVERADKIHVMDEGRVVESGVHAALLQAGGLYARLFKLQSGGADAVARA